ncbi:MAG: type II toxin-antitoxin system death-on-curing family toxin [Clostridiales bacterium]|nr:type II toxin-antitoxin system death-on-curing family toxin [Clostridiales bacterium]
MITLTKEQVLLLHKCIYDRYGGSYGVRDEGLLDSALEAPFQTFAGQDLYPTDMDKIVRFGYGLIGNHPFHDGNKRIGALALLTLLELNGYSIDSTNKEFADIIYSVASGSEGKDYEDLLIWVREHTR